MDAHSCPTCKNHPARPSWGDNATLCDDPSHDMAVAVYDAWAEFKGIENQCDYIPDSPASDPDPFVQGVKDIFGVARNSTRC